MSETRRDVFTTTVITALGVTTAAGAVGGAVGEFIASRAAISPRTPKAPGKGSVVAVYNHNDNFWYLLSFVEPRVCAVFKGFSTSPPDSFVDTNSWLAATKEQVKDDLPIKYNTNGDSITLKFNSSGNVQDGPTNSSPLQMLLDLVNDPSTTNYTSIPGSWNEIGRQ